MPTYVALLRGVNVGGGNKVPMADLRAALADAGATEVATYIQSGNVVLDHPSTSDRAVQTLVQDTIGSVFGLTIPTMVRSLTEMRAVVEACPYEVDDPTKLHVVFFSSDAPDPSTWMDLAPFAPEEITLSGREQYLHLPDGMGRSKLVEALGKGQGRKVEQGTARNWRTVQKLIELADR